ncbi:MAG: AAA family ATPase [Clostridium sp.]
MTMNLAYRMALLNPEAGKNMTHIPGIVLIDELDMHLHPKWQWNVIKALEETFPNIQFIVATHSPIIISSCKNENLILIKGNQEIKYLPNAYGYSVEDVLELRQESTAKPKGNRGFA